MRILLIITFLALLVTSCGRGITIQQAAAGKAKCHRNQHIRNWS